MTIGIVSAAYIAAAVLFILSLGGLSGQRARNAPSGMALWGWVLRFSPRCSGPAWQLVHHFADDRGRLCAGLLRGLARADDGNAAACCGAALLVGLAAVFIGYNAELELIRIEAMRLAGDADALNALRGFAEKLAHKDGVEIAILKVEVFLGVFIGAVTFTGSVIAFGKLAGKVSGTAKNCRAGICSTRLRLRAR